MTPVPFVDGARFSPAELSALRLDGHTMAVGDLGFPLGAGPSFAERCRAIAALVEQQVIAERLTVLWICGCLDEPPVPLQICVDTRLRVAPPRDTRATLRQVVIDAEDVEVHHCLRMTTPARTVADLLRQPHWPDPALLRRYASLTRLGAHEVSAVLDRRGHLANKRRAAARLGLVFGADGG
jgi:hypothetical protein